MILFLTVLLIWAIPAHGANLVPHFDYLGSADGQSAAKAKCASAPKTRDLRCEFTFARLVPADQIRQHFFPDFFAGQSLKGQLSDLELEKKKSVSERLKSNPDQLEELRAQACKTRPKDPLQFRDALGKSYGDFIADAKKIHEKLCKAASPAEFATLLEARETLASHVAEVEYTETEVSLVAEKEANHWSGLSPKMKLDLRCHSEKACQYRIERLDKEPTVTVFNNDSPIQKPATIKYLFDRYRSSDCCAFEE